MKTEQSGAWVDAGALAALPEGKPTLLRHGPRRLAVVRTAEGVHAVDDRCPHEGYPLTQGTVEGTELTCCYHNFKFDLRTGACGRGESVPTFDTRTRAGRVEVFVPDPDPDAERAAAFASLEQGLYERRDGQIARDLVRLLQSGVAPEQLAAFGAAYDADRAPWGSTHALPVAADILPLFARFEGPQAVRPLMQCYELCAESNVRREPRPRVAAIDPGPDVAAAEARYRAAMEAERVDEVEGLMRGAVARGWGRDALEPWLFGPACAHFIGFAHGLIYPTKVFDLIEAGGHAESLLVGVALEQVNATRDDVLPAWAWWRAALSEVAPEFETMWSDIGSRDAREPPGAVDEALVDALLGGDRRRAFDAVVERLRAARLPAVLDALVIAAAERLRRFDPAIDADDALQDSWLDVSHIFTFVQAIRIAAQRHRRPEVLALTLQAARMIQNAGVLDRKAYAPRTALDGGEDPLARLKEAIAAHDGDRAEALVRGWVAARRPLAPLARFFEDLSLYDAMTRPIVVAHLLKTTVAVFSEQARRPDDPRPLAGLARFAAGPVSERFVGSRVHEAVRFIVDGKVPKLLT